MSVLLHAGPALVPVAAVAAVAAVLAAGGVSGPGLPLAAVMFLDLPLGQQARGLPPARAALMLLVLAIELSKDQSPVTHQHSPLGLDQRSRSDTFHYIHVNN